LDEILDGEPVGQADSGPVRAEVEVERDQLDRAVGTQLSDDGVDADEFRPT
jgi:hypothetical protein